MSDKPRRFVRMFKPRFADLVERGLKTQTVRPTPKRMPKPGDIISCRTWTGRPYRSKQRVLREAEILAVKHVEIYGNSIHIGERRLTAEEREVFAKADGFSDFAELSKWFREEHGLPFTGIVIYWK